MPRRPRVVLLAIGLVLVATAALADLTEVWTTLIPRGSIWGGTVAGDGAVYWVGTVRSGFYLYRYDADGSRAWRKKIGKFANTELVAAAATPDSSGVLIGGSKGAHDERVPWVALYDAGKHRQIWATSIDQIEVGSVTAVAMGGASVYVAGTYDPFPGFAEENVFVARLDADGNVLWVKTYDDQLTNRAHAIAIDPKGKGVYVGGSTGDFEGPPYLDTLLQMYDPDGNLKWSKRADGSGAIEEIRSMVVSGNGKKIFAAGYTDREEDESTREVFFQPFKAKTGKGKRWKLHDIASGEDFVFAMAASSNGKTFFIASRGCTPDFGGCSAYLLVTNNKGSLQDMSTVAPDIAGDVSPAMVGVGPDGNPVVGGNATAGNGTAFLRKVMRQ